jgi:glycosyltransferase involved in cell wall biosynthesis
MKLVVDFQGAQNSSRTRGIGRYTNSLTLAIIKNKNKNEDEVILLLSNLFPDTIPEIKESFSPYLKDSQFKIWDSPKPTASLDNSAQENRQLSEKNRIQAIEELSPDLVLVTSYLDCLHDDTVSSFPAQTTFQTGLIFYDAIPLIQSEIYLKPNPHFERIYLEKISQIKNVDLLFAISESAKKEAIEYLNYPKNQVINIKAGTEPFFKKKNYQENLLKNILSKFGIHKPFIMYSGASDERKNQIGLIHAFSLLPKEIKENYHLVLVGGLPDDHRAKFSNASHQFGLSDNHVIITGRVSDEELVALYNSCELFVFPSIHEGFGLPLLEAMSCGAAVLGSNLTSIPEVIGNNNYLFNPNSPEEMSEKIHQVLVDVNLKEKMKSHSMQQCQYFSWDITANILWQELRLRKSKFGLRE